MLSLIDLRLPWLSGKVNLFISWLVLLLIDLSRELLDSESIEFLIP